MERKPSEKKKMRNVIQIKKTKVAYEQQPMTCMVWDGKWREMPCR